GPAAPPVPGNRRHRGGDGRRGLRRVASARLGPGPVAREGLPSGRSRAGAGRVAGGPAPAVAGASGARRGHRRSLAFPADRVGPGSGLAAGVRVVRLETRRDYLTSESYQWEWAGSRARSGSTWLDWVWPPWGCARRAGWPWPRWRLLTAPPGPAGPCTGRRWPTGEPRPRSERCRWPRCWPGSWPGGEGCARTGS